MKYAPGNKSFLFEPLNPPIVRVQRAHHLIILFHDLSPSHGGEPTGSPPLVYCIHRTRLASVAILSLDTSA